jgi:hypothetical protein
MNAVAARLLVVVALAVAGLVTAVVPRGAAKILAEQNKDLEGWTSDFGEDPKDLTHTGRNPYFILEPGHYLVLEKGDERLVITVLNETKVIDGVETRVVEEKETKGGKPVEFSRNYFAISKRTNSVYYFGEDVDVYKDGKIVDHPGVWHSGVKGAKYGLMIPGTPLVRGKYYQEVAPGSAMDRAEIVSLTETVVTPAGTFKNCMKTEETSALESAKAYKLYARGIGQVGEPGDLVLVEHGFLKKGKN